MNHERLARYAPLFAALAAGWGAGAFYARHDSLPARAPHRSTAAKLAGTNEPSGGELGVWRERLSRIEDALPRSYRSLDEPYGTLELFEIAEEMTSADEVVLALEFANMRPAHEKEALIPVLVGRWAAFDPNAAAEYVSKLPASSLRRDCRERMYEAWLLVDARAATDHLLALPVSERGAAIHGAVATLQTIDPESALDFLNRFVRSMESAGGERVGLHALYHSIFSTWAERNADGAIARIEAMPDGPYRRAALKGSFQPWIRRDPKAALDRLERTKELDRFTRSELMAEIAASWARQDLAAARDYIRASVDETFREPMISSILRRASPTPEDASALIELISDDSQRDRARQEWLRLSSKDDPIGALETALAMPAGEDRENSANAALDAWFDLDPEAALAWVLDDSITNRPPGLLGELIPRIADLDPARALELALNRVPKGGRGGFLPSSVLHRWGAVDPETALAFVSKLPNEEMRGGLAAEALGVLAEYDWRRASDLLAGLDEETQARAIPTIAAIHAQTDPSVGLAWAARFGPKAYEKSLQRVLPQWAELDSQSLEAWLDKQPAGPSLDAAIENLSSALRHSDAPAAARWLFRIGDEAKREDSLVAMVTRWRTNDENAARAWVSASPDIPAGLRQKLAKSLDSGKEN